MALACASSALAYVIPHFAAPPRVSPSSHRGGRKAELLEAAELLPLAGALAVAAPLLLLAGERRAAEGPLPPTVLYQAGTTAEGAELMAALTASTFPAAWREAVAALDGRATRAAAEGSGSLQGRIAAVQALEGQRHALADLLAVAVERQLSEAQLSLLPSAASIAPAAGLPPDACSLVRVSQRFPGQSARQVRAFVGESAPSNEPSVNGRFDRLQAARLYQGCIQFGYFIAQVFLGQAHLASGRERILTVRRGCRERRRVRSRRRPRPTPASSAVPSSPRPRRRGRRPAAARAPSLRCRGRAARAARAALGTSHCASLRSAFRSSPLRSNRSSSTRRARGRRAAKAAGRADRGLRLALGRLLSTAASRPFRLLSLCASTRPGSRRCSQRGASSAGCCGRRRPRRWQCWRPRQMTAPRVRGLRRGARCCSRRRPRR
ncbi:hypothetical protein EMIHUDRAFT_425314, partial [Emiliania huxleyi CCMP1516]|uniref:Uncharacterized protein n=2 Tax=Emiliania huxleyi TaxID=2903 RepID=A0A0D3IHL7_EMIH1